MKLTRPSRGAALAFLSLSLGGCSADTMIQAGYDNPRRMARIDREFEARDACLAKNAVPSDGAYSNAAAIAKSVALACKAETDRLIAVSNPTNDPKVTAAIVKDSDFRAMGYVLKARGAR